METMNRIAFFCLCVATLVLTSGAAQAQSSAEITQLDKCITACAGRFRQCVPGTDFNLATVCDGVDECKDISEGAVKAANQICTLCAQGQLNCVTGGGSGNNKRSVKSYVAPGTPADACAEANGVLVSSNVAGAPPVCLTPQYAYDQAMALRSEHAQMMKMLQEIRDGKSAAAPPDQVKIQQLVVRYDELVKGLERIGALEGDVKQLRSDLNQLRQDFDQHVTHPPRAGLALQNTGNNEQVIVTTVGEDKAQTGFTFGPYASMFAQRQFGRVPYSLGLETELVFHMFDDPDKRFVIGLGGGYGGTYYDEHDDDLQMAQLHVNTGIRFAFGQFSITPGIMGINRVTSSDWNSVLSWGGVYLEPGVSLAETDGQALKLFGRAGLGIRHAQHPYDLEGFDDRVGVPLFIGLKFESIPVLLNRTSPSTLGN